LGKPKEFPTFGWDNEYGDVILVTKPIKATKFKITNGEFLEFVKANGYRERKYWGNEGWEWLQTTDKNTWKKEIIDCPLFWLKDSNTKNGFKLRLIFDEIELPLNWPVEVSYHESRAYCAWLQEKNRLTNSFYRLIKEEEFKLIRGDDIIRERNNLSGAQRDFVAFNRELGNTHCQFISPTPVDKYPASPLGFYDTVGNVWEWSESYFRAFPGFKPETFYHDFSGPCFDYYHNNIVGSAWSSTGMSASCFVRISFRRHFYQNCGFRLVEEENLKPIETNPYESKKMIGEYMISNYYYSSPEKTLFGNSQLDFEMNYKDFNTKIAEHAVNYYLQHNNLNKIDDLNLKALDLGCGVGKSTFELAKSFKQVTGLDYSKSFIDICNTLKETGQFDYEYKIHCENYQKATAVIDPDIDRTRVKFIHGDACNLPNELGPFDLIILVNLVDRLQNPRQCLIDLHNKLSYNGVLIISSPFTWMEEYTPKEFWIGGKDGVSTFDALKELMEGFCFNLADQRLVSMIIREHSLKYQLNLSMMTVWTKKKFNGEFATTIFKK
jgi:putative 4-mercaptohistidine N1-methyltranferase